MYDRLYWIAISYLTRPLFIWLVLGGAVFALPILIIGIDKQQPTPLLAIMGALILPALGLGLQLFSQFRGPASRLMPGFAAPHAFFGTALAVGLVVLMAARLILEPGASVAGSILLPSALVSVVLACTASTAARGGYQIQISRDSKLIVALMLFLPLSAVGMCGALFSQTLRPRLLAANDPVTVVILVFTVAASSALTIWLLNRLADWASGAGSDDRRLPADIFLSGQRTNRIQPEPLSHFGTQFRDRQERQIEELSHRGELLSRWGKIKRWRLGNASHGPSFLVSLLILIPMLISVMGVTRFLFGTWFNTTALHPIPFLYLAMFSSMAGTQWRLRTLVLPLEILRPTSRASLQREWMWALLLDLLAGTISFAAIQSIVLNYVPPLGMVWSRVPPDFLLLLPVGMCIAAGLASMVAIIRRTWLLVLLGYSLFILTLLANSWARSKFGPLNNVGPLNRDGLEAFFSVPALIGLAVACVMARRWRKLEIGTVS